MRHWQKTTTAVLTLALTSWLASDVARAVEVVYQYDSAGRLTRIVQDGEEIAYGFDAAGNLTTVTVPEPSGGLGVALVMMALASHCRFGSTRRAEPRAR